MWITSQTVKTQLVMKGYLITLVIVVAGVLLAGYLKDKVFNK